MPGSRRAGRQAAPFPSPAGNIVKGDPVGTAGEVRGGQTDDADAAEELFRGVYPKLAGWVRRLVDDDDTAHEIPSEAFVRLLARWTKVESPQSYLYMIATNLIRDHWRKTERERRAIRSVTAGTAVLDVISPCVTFNDHEGSTKSYAYVKDHDAPVNTPDYIAPQEEITVDY